MVTKELPVTNCPLKTKTLSDKRRWEVLPMVVEEQLAKWGLEIIDGGVGWVRIMDTKFPIVEEEPGDKLI